MLYLGRIGISSPRRVSCVAFVKMISSRCEVRIARSLSAYFGLARDKVARQPHLFLSLVVSVVSVAGFAGKGETNSRQQVRPTQETAPFCEHRHRLVRRRAMNMIGSRGRSANERAFKSEMMVRCAISPSQRRQAPLGKLLDFWCSMTII